MNTQQKVFGSCYYGFFVTGLCVLLIGTIMPYLIESYGISYAIAGSFLSCFALGNLASSFFSPYLSSKIGPKYTVVILFSLIPLCFLMIYFSFPVWTLYLGFLLAGIGRGAISNINNVIVNDFSNGKSTYLNVLHSFFAVGAFIAPFLTSLYIAYELNWRLLLLTAVFLCTTSIICYARIPLTKISPKRADIEKSPSSKAFSMQSLFHKDKKFYIVGFLLFFYVGLENCVNGWFVTYLKSIGVLTPTYATNLLSILWIIVIIGRLSCAYLSIRFSKKLIILINSIGCVFFFFLLIATQNTFFITLSMIGLGLFLAGIFPTCIADIGPYVKGRTADMALLLAIANLGGMLLPQIIGALADQIGMVSAISLLLIDLILMLILAIANYKSSSLSI